MTSKMESGIGYNSHCTTVEQNCRSEKKPVSLMKETNDCFSYFKHHVPLVTTSAHLSHSHFVYKKFTITQVNGLAVGCCSSITGNCQDRPRRVCVVGWIDGNINLKIKERYPTCRKRTSVSVQYFFFCSPPCNTTTECGNTPSFAFNPVTSLRRFSANRSADTLRVSFPCQ